MTDGYAPYGQGINLENDPFGLQAKAERRTSGVFGGRREGDRIVRRLIELGIALSAERNTDRLLEMILLEAKQIYNADGGTLYLTTDDTRGLAFKIMIPTLCWTASTSLRTTSKVLLKRKESACLKSGFGLK